MSSDHLPARAPSIAVAYLDVIVVVVAAIPALALGAPALGYAIGGGTWIGQRVLQVLDRRWTRAHLEPRRAVAINLFERFGRIWLLAGAIVVAAVAGGREDGLTAALVIFATYSIAFVVRLFTGPPPARSEESR